MDVVETTVARNRIIALAMAGGVVFLAAIGGLVEIDPVPWAARASLAVGLIGLIALVAAWRVYSTMIASIGTADLEAALARYTTALISALAITEGAAFLGVVCFMLGGRIEALTGIVTHVMLTGVLWPTAEKARPAR
jgi:hypothetical protein